VSTICGTQIGFEIFTLNDSNMKLFTIVAWACGIIAVLLMIMGIIPLITGENLFGIRHEINFFLVANTVLLLGILCVLAQQGCSKKE
jgi:predicted membrane channel-forming protein YqfA (hemolysin III family)